MSEKQRRTIQVENLTRYPTAQVNRVARWAAREVGLNEAYGESAHRFLIRVAHHNGGHVYQGRWYWNPAQAGAAFYAGQGEWADIQVKVPVGVNHLALCRIPKPGACRFPAEHDHGLRGGPPTIVIEDWQQALVGIVAHEGYHAWQHARRAKRRAAGRKARYSEVECEWAEYRILERWKEAYS